MSATLDTVEAAPVSPNQETVTFRITLCELDFGDGDVAQLIRNVTASLLEQPGVAGLQVSPTSKPQKGPIPADLGQLIIELQVEILAAVVGSAVISTIGVLTRWARRRPERSVIVDKDGRQISLKGDGDPEDQTRRLLDGVEAPQRPQPNVRRRRYALLITTSSYEDATLQALPGVESDGRLLADILKDPEVGDYQRVQQLHNPAARAAVRAVKMFFRERSEDDLALIYFSGHGLKKDNDLFFATEDTDSAELPATTVPAKLIADEAAKSKCAQVVVILDCCYGGAFSRGNRHAPEEVQPMLSPMVSRPDFVLLSATGETEFAVDVQAGEELVGTDLTHQPSLFTDLIINGLDSGDADENGDGEVTSQELFSYLKQQLKDLHSDTQAPIIEERRRGSAIMIAKSRQVRATIPAQIKRKLTDPSTFSAGLHDLVRLDERRRGGQRRVVVRTLMSSYSDSEDAARTEIVHALAKLAQQPITRTAVPPRRPRGRRFRARVAVGTTLTAVAAIIAGLVLWANVAPDRSATADEIAPVSGEITINGSSTVEPVVQQVATEFQEKMPKTHANIAGAGTGTGFEIFCGQQAGSEGIDLVGASRPINAGESSACAKNKIRHERFLLGYDGMSVVTSTQNDFLNSLNYDQLRAIFGRPNLQSWRQVNPAFPDRPMATCTPDAASGTFDFFVDHVLAGNANAFRDDGARNVRSQDDNNLAQCVQSNPYAIGFFGYAYYRENSSRLKLVAIAEKPDSQPELPTEESVLADLYPLKRPLFVYVRLDSIIAKPQVREFLKFLILRAERAVRLVGYVPAYSQVYESQRARIDELTK